MLRSDRKKQVVAIGFLILAQNAGFATEGESVGIAGIATNVSNTLTSLVGLISKVAYVAGFMFFLASIMKFKQHKDNPTQVPVGTPVSMVAMGAALMFAGNFITPLGQSIFGSSATAGSSSGDISSGLGEAASSS